MLCLFCCNVYNENILRLKTFSVNHFQAIDITRRNFQAQINRNSGSATRAIHMAAGSLIIGLTILATKRPTPASHWLWLSNWWLMASTTKRSTSATGPTTRSLKGGHCVFFVFYQVV